MGDRALIFGAGVISGIAFLVFAAVWATAKGEYR